MCLSRINRLLCISIIGATLASCATTGGDSGQGDMDTTSGSAGVENDPLQGGLWNEKLWKDAPQPYVAGLKAAKAGRSGSAMKSFRKSIYDFPQFAPAYTNLGLQQLKLNDLDAAETSLKKAVEIEPDDAVAHNHLGVISRKKGKFDLALNAYKKAIAIKPDYANAYLNLGILQDLYLYDLRSALANYEKYQSLTSKKDTKVSKWIVEIKRRIGKGNK